jgi:hypothetical protein
VHKNVSDIFSENLVICSCELQLKFMSFVFVGQAVALSGTYSADEAIQEAVRHGRQSEQ